MRRYRTIGVIGGMGPAATADFLSRLVAGVNAASDTDHPRVLVDSNPHVPDRNAAALTGAASPGPVLAEMGAALVAQGAQLLAMPCNAAHGWADAITAAPFISMIDAAIAEAMAHQPRCIGVLGVGATLALDLYGRASPVPVLAGDLTVVQPAVNAIKAGDRSGAVRSSLAGEAARLAAAGADVVIAACTEVPLLLTQADVAVPLIDSTAALARATLAAARLPDRV
ncbi:amino acid racemase [Sandarakinorhabdus sp.]|jgi:aspartate racemase|uniref:aspartate/glutamate racemase family protein n=1 Tax=Sandarakinorhabdus sp. TaxID=1916663 RepID=UPI0028ADB8AF|nr:amino acid racemase [Sandarakinorhabdus sp.]